MFRKVKNEMSVKGVKGLNILNTGAVRLATVIFALTVMFSLPCFTEEKPVAVKVPPPVLYKAVLCEKIAKNKPVYEGVVFSLDIEKLYCYTYFEPVYGESNIYHKYYFNDKLISC